ncbi:MAG TPA: alpha/beta hydrolase-fold protein [Gaiellaceae bacterium]|nr:alpha/beta hydrolase-fold protein [Gaiellaceae bacterium]
MRLGLGVLLAALVLCTCACGSSDKPAPPPKVTSFALKSALLGRPLYEVLVTPAGGGKGRSLLVFLHGYGAAPSDTLSPAFVSGLRRLGDQAPVVVLPEGDIGWWHDRAEGAWGSYVLREVIPAALARSGADSGRVAIGGISMGGFGALDLGRIEPGRFCAVGGHSPAVLTRDDFGFGFDNAADYARHNLLSLARKRSLYDSPVWIDVGDHDRLRPASARLARELHDHGTEVSFHVWPGSHDGRYWDAHFAEYLRFYADACA